MNCQKIIATSDFGSSTLQVRRLLSRFQMRFHRWPEVMEHQGKRYHSLSYGLFDHQAHRLTDPSGHVPAASLISYSYLPRSQEIEIEAFYPQLNFQEDPRFLSAATFYLTLDHFMTLNKLPAGTLISGIAHPKVFWDFYGKLPDFDFQVDLNFRQQIFDRFGFVYTEQALDFVLPLQFFGSVPRLTLDGFFPFFVQDPSLSEPV